MDNPSVINIAYFAETPEMKNTLLLYSKIREMTLDQCYAIPDYENLPPAEKDRIYDSIHTKIVKEMTGGK